MSGYFPNIPSAEQLTHAQKLTIVSLERTGGCISLVAVILIFVTYWLVPRVRNVQNTFIVFASVSNAGASVASAIAMDGLRRGRSSGLCQAQSFLFEMFMQSDPWWSLAMAVNVFLVFYFRANPDSLQRWWWLYCLICYGGPFVIALVLLLVRHPRRGLVYGEATIWCWVDRSWDDIRIYTYYMLIWICIVGSIVIYFLVGYHVFQSRNQLRSFSTSSKSREAAEGPKIKLPSLPDDGFYGTVITEVQVIHSSASTSTLPGEPKKAHLPAVSFDADHTEREPQPSTSQYFSTVTSVSPEHYEQEQRHRDRRSPPGAFGRLHRRVHSVMRKFVVADPIKRAYLRTSFLFGLSVLVTWIPSSMNRIHSWLTGESPYEYHVATAAVLPLQGLWNAVIFFVTSSRALRKGWDEWRNGGPTVDENEEIGGVARSAVRNDMGEESDEEMEGLGSDVELRQMAVEPGKRSSSL